MGGSAGRGGWSWAEPPPGLRRQRGGGLVPVAAAGRRRGDATGKRSQAIGPRASRYGLAHDVLVDVQADERVGAMDADPEARLGSLHPAAARAPPAADPLAASRLRFVGSRACVAQRRT